MPRRTVHLALAAMLLAVSPDLADAGTLSVANNGEALGDALVSVETLSGEQLATTRTDAGGVADCNIPRVAAGQPLVFKVTDKAGSITEQYLFQPAGKPWHLVAMDIQAGIVGYSKETYDHLKAAMEPIYVGKNSEVGSGARLKSQIKQSVGGGAFGGGKSGFSLGGGGGGMSGMRLASPEPKGDRDIETHDDPIDDADKRIFTNSATGAKVAVGSRHLPEGLLVSTSILEAPGDGTFQSMSLMDADGNMAGPTRYMIFQTYMDWWLQVHWWRKTYVDGQLVSHEEGGWSDEGRILGDKYSQPIGSDGIWNRTGFGSALGGMQGLGAVFPKKQVDWDNYKIPLDLSNLVEPTMTVVTHITLPKEDPVLTTPFAIALASTEFRDIVREVALEGRMDDVKAKIEETEKKITYLRRGLPLKESPPTNTKTGEPIYDSATWNRMVDERDRKRIADLETELRDLRAEQTRLEWERDGRFDPVAPHLQPIVILA